MANLKITHVGDSIQAALDSMYLWVMMVPVHLNLIFSFCPNPIFTK